MTKRPLPKGAILIPENAKCVFRGEIFDTYQWRQKLYDGSHATFEMLRRPDTVTVLAVTGDDEVVLLEQEQPNKPKHFALPAGRIEADEDPLTAAKRELLEETGLSFNQWKLKSVVQPVHKVEWFHYTYLATERADEKPQNLDAGEKISVQRVPYARIIELIKKNYIGWSEYLVELIIAGKVTLQDALESPNFEEVVNE